MEIYIYEYKKVAQLRSLSYKKWVSYHYLRHHVPSIKADRSIYFNLTKQAGPLPGLNHSTAPTKRQYILQICCVLKSTPYTLPVDFLAYPVSRSTITEYAFTAYTIYISHYKTNLRRCARQLYHLQISYWYRWLKINRNKNIRKKKTVRLHLLNRYIKAITFFLFLTVKIMKFIITL